jgi:hypothetical protein
MDISRMADLTDGFTTKADKMRVLERAGYTRGDIARFLGVRYQQVRNTLEGDKRTGYSPPLVAARGDADGPTESAGGVAPFRAVVIGDDGFANLPPDLIEDFVDEGAPLFAVATKDGIFVSSLRGMNARVLASFR